MGLTGIDLVGLSSGHAAGETRYVYQAITGDTNAVRALGEFLASEDEVGTPALVAPAFGAREAHLALA